LKCDPVLASRVLHVANSPTYATRRGRVTTVEEAVRNIGLSGVCKVVSTAGIFEAFGGGKSGGINLLRCWQHCFAVAELMNRLVGKSDNFPAGLLHLIGLCHGLGEIVLREEFAREHAIASQIAAESGKPLRQVESAVFGIAYHELVCLAISRLGLPVTITKPIDEYHQAQAKGRRCPQTALSHLLSLANTLAHGLLLASSPDATVRPFGANEYTADFAANAAQIPNWKGFRGEVVVNINLLVKLSSSDEAALSMPLLPAKSARVWYARDPSFAHFDPLAVALEFLADTQVHNDLPGSAAELADCDGIVVALPCHTLAAPRLKQIQRMKRDFQNQKLPVLCLSTVSSSEPGSPNRKDAESGSLPVSLATLHQFVSKLPSRTAKPNSAEAI
jgi:HD-like signal output (HDOD) protein